ncbi:alpha/beta fold hydrolase [Roseicella aquatilis]|uniref:Alpha/beta hydrolase n=1 Tax=Roseicella aquatilis TaxID=2527868 RepID=A0A4R4DTM1_9PROT|nr:alpha/beta hydrolase [Roseicella aquatilis]TCZ65338.1 alpha/beta hydrolase [Roseicella aquatilis]
MAPRRRCIGARDGLRLAALDWEGPREATPLLCLSGIARSGLDFLGVAARYAGTRRIVALDYAGHGESGRAGHPRRYRPENALHDVLDAMAALGLHRVALLGTSFGGILGMAIGTVRPGVLAGLALNDTGPELQSGGLGLIKDLIGRDPAFPNLEEAAAFLRANLPPLGIADDAWPGVAERTYRQGQDGRWHPRWDIRIAEILPRPGEGAPDLWRFFRAVPEIPTLLVWGQESAVLSAATVAEMRRARPGMALCSLPGIAHAPPLADPASLAALDRWLAQMP